ncbi:MAG: nicotinate-nucleotide adenylyltransferase [Pseudomonadota bacterium]|nr:nicotinate-nucleotide adenylyltransferase [Pseudomonadota bacterium]
MRRAGGFVRLPPFGPGQGIGLLGGSFNPPHDGHVLASHLALSRLALSRVWWLATPGNPLKSTADLAALRARLDAARALVRDPRIAVTGFESEIGSRYTADTLRYLTSRAPGARFVWIMGADNLAQFHRWRDWEEIAAMVPMLVVDRPGSSAAALSSRAAQALARWRRPESDAQRLAYMAPPAWIFLHGRRSSASSTALRAQTADRR